MINFYYAYTGPFCNEDVINHLFGMMTKVGLPFNILISYAMFKGDSENMNNKKLRFVSRVKEYGSKVILDSGAFAVYNRGEVITNEEYLGWVEKHISYFDRYVYLDEINSSRGTFKNIKQAYIQGFKDGIPVFHSQEPAKYLKFYSKKFDYIGLSPRMRNYGSTDANLHWLSYLMNMFPKKKYHLFGVTSLRYIRELRPYSCDSVGYKLSAGYGSVYDQKGRYVHYKDLDLNFFDSETGEVFLGELKVNRSKALDLLRSDFYSRFLWNALQIGILIRDINKEKRKSNRLKISLF